MTLPLQVLIADDNHTDRMILGAIVRKEGHDVIEAADGREAVELYADRRPDLVLLDALMPVQDGMEAAREIKALAGDELVPIIFLTSLQDADSLAGCLQAGGDDFLSKPYKRVILRAKLQAFSRMRSMHAALQDNHRQLLLEQSVARKVYDNVTQAGHVRIDNLRYSLSSRAMFNGDTVLAQYRPDGGLHVLLGDFTGHGLPAAIGAMPLAETFYGMTAKGFELEEIVREMNSKLNRVLPTNFFCCAVALHVDMREKTARAWVGGVPDCFLYCRSRQTVKALPSLNLPLGVTEGHQFSLRLHEFAMRDGDRLFMWSDGIVEAENQGGELFGEARLREIFRQAEDPEQIFTELLLAVSEFQGDQERADDTTLVELTMTNPPLAAPPITREDRLDGQGKALDWEVRFVFPATTLRHHNPMPLIMHVINETEGLSAYSSQLYTIISELYSNALEHGVLELDSSLKASGEGFGRYYRERQQRLDELTAGEIILTMVQRAHGNSGVLTIRMEDSGPGFDHGGPARHPDRASGKSQSALSGRGMTLVRELCSRVEYLGRGNLVEVDFHWPRRRL